MENYDKTERLIKEVSILRFALAQMYINQCRQHGRASLLVIVKSWIDQASVMQQKEWEAGTRAFYHYLRYRRDKSAQEARIFLKSQLTRHEEQAHKLFRSNRKKGYKPPLMMLTAEFQVSTEFNKVQGNLYKPNCHRATRGAFDLSSSWWKAWNHPLGKMKNWRKNEKK